MPDHAHRGTAPALPRRWHARRRIDIGAAGTHHVTRGRLRVPGRAGGDRLSAQPFRTSRYIGLDDVVPKTRASVAEAARVKAIDEMNEIADAFDDYLAGKKGPWLVPADRLGGRLDAKTLLPWSVDQLAGKWKADGIASDVLENLVDPVDDPVAVAPDEKYSFLRKIGRAHV